jgi:DNA-binding transcriptional regulator YhcF (GntR family)
MQAFSMDHGSSIPVKMQLKAHVKYQITAGILRPGDQLPPLRDLAAGLGVHLNTVVRAVDELETEGYLYSHQGKGVFVADEFPGQGHGAALRSLLAGVLQSSRDWNMTPEELAMALMAHGQLAKPPRAAPYRLLLVSGSRPQLRRLQGELETLLPVVVETALVEELPEKVRAGDYRVAASTLFHEADLRTHLPGATRVTLAGAPALEAFASLRDLPAGSLVAIASRDWLHAARVHRSLELCGLDDLQLEAAAGHTPASLAPLLGRARAVLATPDCREIAREALGGRTNVLLLPEPIEVPSASLATIRRALGVPATEQRVHVRSAWV